MKDMLKNDINVGDYILVYDVNHMQVTRVKELCSNDMFLTEDDLSYSQYNSRKCVVINEQRKHNIEKFPERYI